MKSNLIIALTALTAVMTTAAHAVVVLPHLNPVTIDDSGYSVNGDTPSAIDFVNHLSYAVDVYWIDYSGDREFYEDVAAHSSFVQDTYLTHPWLIVEAGSGDTTAQGTGTLITAFIAETPVPVEGDVPPGGADIANIGVPEPATWATMTLGLAGLGAMARRRRRGMVLAAV